MVYTLKTNRRPIATAREMDVGLDEVGDSGRRDGMERRGEERGRVHKTREGGTGSVGQESESCHKNDNNKKPQCHPVTTSRLV